jgi:hypothetical protein
MKLNSPRRRIEHLRVERDPTKGRSIVETRGYLTLEYSAQSIITDRLQNYAPEGWLDHLRLQHVRQLEKAFAVTEAMHRVHYMTLWHRIRFLFGYNPWEAGKL